MNKTVSRTGTGVRWDFTTVLEDLDFADDIALLSSTMNHLQEKTTKLETNVGKVGLKLNNNKCKIIKTNSKSQSKTTSKRKRCQRS